MVPPDSDRAPPTPPYSGSRLGWQGFRVRGCHPLRRAFPGGFRYPRFFLQAGPTTPRAPRRPRFGLAPFRSPLLGGSLLFSSPPPTWMFRFGGFASPHRVMPCLRMAGCPIRTPADLRPFAPPRRLSRPAASFLASGSQGILRAPSLASRSSVSTRSLVSVFLPSCQRTAQGESLLRVENVGLEPTTPGLQSRCSSQLSQSPRRVVPGRLELPTPTLSVWCSNQLSYGTPAPAEDPETRPAALAACAPSVFSLSVCSGQHRRRLLRDPCGNPPERRCSSRTFRYGYLVTT